VAPIDSPFTLFTPSLTALPGSPFASSIGIPIMAINPAGTFAYLTLSSDHTVAAFAINAVTGALTPVAGGSAPAGNDPYNLAVAPSRKFAYCSRDEYAVRGDYTVRGRQEERAGPAS
jgi:hypothetical protein